MTKSLIKRFEEMTRKEVDSNAKDFDAIIAKRFLNKKTNAEQRGLEFSLSFTSFKNIMKAKKCYYTKTPIRLYFDENGQADDALTIDRIDASKGYCKGNVVATCRRFNMLKGRLEQNGDDAVMFLYKGLKARQKRIATKKAT